MKYYLVALILFFAQARCQINKSSDLNCKFNTPCRWRNETNKLEYGGEFLLDSEVKVGRSIIITAKDRRESELFAVTHANYFGEQKAALISDLIGCQIGGATMTLWYYRTGRTSVLKACIREPPGSVDLSSYTCFPLTNKKHNLRWIFSAIEFPPIAQPFELIIEATFVEPNDLIAIDDITFNATLCESSSIRSNEGAGGNFSTTDFEIFPETDFFSDSKKYSKPHDTIARILSSKTLKKLIPINDQFIAGKKIFSNFLDESSRFVSHCPTFDCNFDDGTTCNYVNDQLSDDQDLLLDLPPTLAKKWKLSNHNIGNSLTGIPGDRKENGYFLYAYESNSQMNFILKSRSARVAKSARLGFWFYMAGKHGRLRVCIDSFDNCPFERSTQHLNVNSRRWIRHELAISQGLRTIYFIADRLRNNYVIAIDEIQLLNKFGNASEDCE